jgi:hypothetical protein
MPEKIKIYCNAICKKVLIASFFCVLACDPCRELAEQICYCKGGEEGKKCLSDLNLASQSVFFKNAKDLHICEEALKKCTCEQINNNQDTECGMSRSNVE